MAKKNYSNNKTKKTNSPKFQRNDCFSGKGNNRGNQRRSDAKAGVFNAEMDRSQDTIKHLGEVENDATFYFSSEEYIKPFASLPFNNIAGLKTVGWRSSTKKLNNRTLQCLPSGHVVPGVLTVDFLPAVGYSDAATSPLNVAALKNYAFIRHENSGSTNYDATNLMMYNMAVLGLIPSILHLRRALLSIGLYSEVNRYAPDTLIRSMGFNPEDLRKNLASYIGQYNLLISRFNKFAIPAGFKHILRWEFLVSNIFMDRKIAKSQLYMFRPVACTEYREIETESGLPELYLRKLVDIDGIKMETVQHYIDELNYCLDKLYLSDSIGVMSGDVLKAYGLENLYKLSPISPSDTIIPVYSETALWQIHNCSTIPAVSFISGGKSLINPTQAFTHLVNSRMIEVVDSTNATSYLTYQFTLSGVGATPEAIADSAMASAYLGSASLMDVDIDNPNFKDVLEITRTKTLSTGNIGDNGVKVDVFGTEVYLQFNLWDMSNTGVKPASSFTSYWDRYMVTEDINAQMDAAISRLAAFDWAPIIYSVLLTSAGIQAERLFSDLDNSVYTSSDDVKQINTAVMQYVFGLLG